MANHNQSAAGGLAGINPPRLFLGSCFSLISTSVTFAVMAAIMGALKEQFVLTNEQVGNIAGAATWGFTISIFIFGPLVDAVGMGLLMGLAFLFHLAGPLMMIFAPNYGVLISGALITSLGNGVVEAVCNPLVATLYPTRKTQMLNRFHVWFPGGITIGAVICFALGAASLNDWRLKVALILIPTLIYGILFLGARFPKTERVQSGLTFGDMVSGAFSRPLFWLLLLCMCLTASMELGPNRWVPSVLEAGGIAGILVLAYINILMAVLRFFAGTFVHRLSPTGVLFGSAVLAAVGLFWLSFASSLAIAFVAATIFALGVCYFWPTMLGVTAERVPKGGSLALALMGGMGMLIVGAVTTPQMGNIADKYVYQKLDPAQTVAIFEKAAVEYPKLAAQAKGKLADDYKPGIEAANKALAEIKQNGGKLNERTANDLRAVIKAAEGSPVSDAAKALLLPADNYGGCMSFRYVAPLGLFLAVVFGLLFVSDKLKGGYKAEHLGAGEAASEPKETVGV